MTRTMYCLLALALLLPSFAAAQNAPGKDSPAAEPSAEEKYTASITKRAAAIVESLQLQDTAKAARVRDRIVAQYRALRDWHAANDEAIKPLKKENTSEAKAKLAEINATLKPIHDSYLSDLSADLTPEQVDQVKDGMTYNVLHVTYNGYTNMILTLTDEQKAYILQQLTEAREIAMDQGSSEEKHAVFGKYKGKINIYLSKAGYDMKQEEKGWQERLRKERAAKAAATQPG